MIRAEALQALVHKHFAGTELIASEVLTGGVAAEVSMLEVRMPDGRARTITLREHGPTYPGLPLEIEFELLKSLTDAGIQVPRPLAKDDSRSNLENPILLLEFVEGTTSTSALEPPAYIRAMAEQLAAIHATPTEALPRLPARMDPVPELLEWLTDDSDYATYRATIGKLQSTAFAGTPALLHGDFWPMNVIWNERAIAAVIDWEDAALGDPLSDVACTALELRYVFGKPGEEQFLEAYSQHAPIDHSRLALWQVYVAVAGCRSMGEWGLAPEREASMRQIASEVIEEAAAIIRA